MRLTLGVNRFAKNLRSRLPLECSDVVFAFGVSAAWALFYNLEFWRATAAAMWVPTVSGILFLVSLFVTLIVLQALILLVIPRRVLKPTAMALFLVAAVASYFGGTYGVLFDAEMLRNAVQTDAAEVSSLIGPRLIAAVGLLGVLPAVLVSRVSLTERGWRRSARARAIAVTAGLGAAIGGALLCAPSYASFLREHKPIRYSIAPGSVVYAAARLIGSSRAADTVVPLADPGGTATRIAMAGRKPLVLFLVIGETARSASFQLGGYPRATNPELAQRGDIVYFGRVVSCGTSTAVSVPCLFSGLGRERYDHDIARRSLNLLDMLVRAGFDVQWRDNNAGCKGVCDRIETSRYVADAGDALCARTYCYDERMLTDLPERLGAVERDTVIVFHQIGSHGPAYSERYPAGFEVFRPACRTSELQRCSRAEVRNAYDNSIRYTDHVLAAQIALLQQAAPRVDGMLLYVSDHGESLGEKGVYLHGMPYGLAPRVQKEVPLILWMSPGYLEHADLALSCVRAHSQAEIAHDNVFHTVLGMLGVRNAAYRESLDLTAGCHSRRLVSSPGPVQPVRKRVRSS